MRRCRSIGGAELVMPLYDPRDELRSARALRTGRPADEPPPRRPRPRPAAPPTTRQRPRSGRQGAGLDHVEELDPTTTPVLQRARRRRLAVAGRARQRTVPIHAVPALRRRSPMPGRGVGLAPPRGRGEHRDDRLRPRRLCTDPHVRRQLRDHGDAGVRLRPDDPPRLEARMPAARGSRVPRAAGVRRRGADLQPRVRARHVGSPEERPGMGGRRRRTGRKARRRGHRVAVDDRGRQGRPGSRRPWR
ncbi:hypothetical protein STANM309S_05150 [Streptomyces tanashiensis]